MQKFKILSLVAAALTLSAASVDAGSKFTNTGNVVVLVNSSGAGTATGYLGNVWNSPLQNQYIGCNVYGVSGVFCHARSEAGKFVACNVGSAFLAESMAALGPDVRLAFTWNASGRCESITIEHSSQLAPKL